MPLVSISHVCDALEILEMFYPKPQEKRFSLRSWTIKRYLADNILKVLLNHPRIYLEGGLGKILRAGRISPVKNASLWLIHEHAINKNYNCDWVRPFYFCFVLFAELKTDIRVKGNVFLITDYRTIECSRHVVFENHHLTCVCVCVRVYLNPHRAHATQLSYFARIQSSCVNLPITPIT